MIKNNKIKRKPIRGLPKIPRINSADLKPTILAMRKGDEEARERLVLGHIALAGSIAASYAGVLKYDQEDILGVAMLAVVDAIDRISIGSCKHENYGGYISLYVSGKIQNFLDRNYIVKPENYYKTKNWVKPVQVRLDPPKESRDDYDGEPTEHIVLTLTNPVEERQHSKNVEGNLFTSPWFTPKEKNILRLKYEGYTQKQIATRVGLSHQRVSQLLEQLHEPVAKWLKENR